ncbi:hypothetical protein PAHAL_1G246200 [Panicum hallii]|jgi:hypothetical protein|uniref:Uncharacterized protein n=1 Tax=Panicum hallii TaxID=206008 RepID=A0A2T8KW80_9POAL|nr:hypothetical protein PAHAL_1G246200 [Panicum hallii]
MFLTISTFCITIAAVQIYYLNKSDVGVPLQDENIGYSIPSTRLAPEAENFAHFNYMTW